MKSDPEPYPTMAWRQFHDHYFRWSQGEHVMVCAGTGWGKTTLIARILDKRQHVFVVGTKFKDETYDDFARAGFTRIEKWPPPRNKQRILLWPRASRPTIKENTAMLRDRIAEALNKVFAQGGWTVVVDETHYVSNEMGLSRELATFQHQGRSSGLTNVLGFQRPSHMPLIIYDSATHVFAARSSLKQDAARLAELGGHSAERIGYTLARLEKFSYLYIPTRDPSRSPVVVNTAR